MSGDVQPRKRKDKKRKKDELGVEEPRGTAAVFGEGDVFMHSPLNHGTGGHWCAKIIFFSLLAVLITLVGLIILENRGLTELEANAVESRYSGVLEGWLEEAPDDHHDEHTLELKHPDTEDDQNEDHSNEVEQDHDIVDDNNEDNDEELDGQENDDGDEDENEQDDEDVDHDDENEQEVDEKDADQDDQTEQDDEDDEDRQDESDEQNLEKASDEDDDTKRNYMNYYESDEDQDDSEKDEYDGGDDESENDDDLRKLDDNAERDDGDRSADQDIDDDDENDPEADENDDDSDQSLEKNANDAENNPESDEEEGEDNSDETQDNEDEYDHGLKEEDLDVEVEKIEKEVIEESDEEPISSEQPAIPDTDDGDEKSEEKSKEHILDDDIDIDEDFLEPDDIEEPPVVEHITVPAGKPLPEVEEETSSEKPHDTLADEEEYEKQQEELRREKEQASHMWLKVVVGGALLVATHAVVRRATAPRDTPVREGHAVREETPEIVRRMTLIAEEITPEIPIIVPQERSHTAVQREIKNVPFVTKSVQISKQESEDEEEDTLPFIPKDITAVESVKDDEDKELYSDEDEDETEEEIVEVEKEIPKPSALIEKEKSPGPDEDDPDDVEIIDEEQLDEDLLEEEEDEEEISDVDDAELLRRLEAKYGRLPEPERPGQKHKDGGNSIENDWPGEPSEAYWRQQLDEAERELRQGEWSAAVQRAGAAELRGSARARYVKARALEAGAEARRDNAVLSQAIAAYLDLLKMNDRLSDKRLVEVADRTLDRIRFRGNYMGAEPVYKLLIRRFPDDPSYRNNLSISFLMANRADLAEEVLKETLQRWPKDRVALAHLGFVLKTLHNRLEEAVDAFQKALEGDAGAANEPRFYYHLGDALLLLGRHAEAHEVHKRGAALGHFLSPAQRSLYNVERLRGRPWWNVEHTPYTKLARALEKSWKEILKEGEAAKALYEQEKEGLKERGEWSQLDLYVRGREIPDRCKRAPVTCSIVRQEAAAAGCRRGQIKFSAMEAGTHVRPHVGPTNCRLRMHLGLSNTKDTYIRVDQETRQWQLGKVLMFDDSFEHEVWHNGTGTRLVLIVDVWHPDLTPTERRQLPAI